MNYPAAAAHSIPYVQRVRVARTLKTPLHETSDETCIQACKLGHDDTFLPCLS